MPEIVVRFGDKIIQRHVAEKPRISIGRTADNDIVLDNKAVSRKHAEPARDVHPAPRPHVPRPVLPAGGEGSLSVLLVRLQSGFPPFGSCLHAPHAPGVVILL